jgi:hypothetical protein
MIESHGHPAPSRSGRPDVGRAQDPLHLRLRAEQVRAQGPSPVRSVGHTDVPSGSLSCRPSRRRTYASEYFVSSAFVAFAVAPMSRRRSIGSRRSGGNRGSLSGIKRRAK